MPFRKGQSGNPSGRPKKIDSLAEMVRSASGEQKKKLVDRMWKLAVEPHDRPDIAIKAADWIADRGWPHEKNLKIELSGRDGGPIEVHDHFTTADSR